MSSPIDPKIQSNHRHGSSSPDSTRNREQVGDYSASRYSMSAGEYLRTRVTTLRPPMHKVSNPIPLLRMLTGRQWAFFAVALSAWTWDALDFFTVSLTVTDLAKDLHRSKTDITWAITLVLMFRSVGAIIFGILSDRYGRKWPFIVNNFLFVVIELGTGFCVTFEQFLACRAIFGIAMGGLYGNAAATALEDCPDEARGLISGMLQQGYALGYLLCVVFARALVNTTPHGWRPLFWFAAVPPVLIMIARYYLPENDAYISQQRLRAEAEINQNASVSQTFIRQGKVALRRHWLGLIYLVLLMAGFNFMSHGSQDIYPVMLSNQFGFNHDMVTVTQVVANLGAICGGTTVGYLSQFFGRRLTIMVCCVVGGALLYPYTFVSSYAVIAAAFFEQFCVQGAWGVIPIHLMELSPGAIRTFVVGTSYQLGNLASSASSTIEARLGERFPLPPTPEGDTRYEYGRVICIFMGCVYGYLLILTFLGPEKMGRAFDAGSDDEAMEVAGVDAIQAVRGMGVNEEKKISDDVEKGV
ncbi:hypothetical protein SAPIO_CDS6105 [Scedosporium apiospermum]|uniref:Major facilitator superfamily (MFS) profile domain-containing protein n=1 Tax=Pseudallescheria apiosperma TaxID=563466 RepID=A0A084G4I7_PSEDA|nr:uncharacterized protein SAPIO_CDS6105 [Scedosporium apiospermum]KEZ42249.1 hypothetical protein SAPIO_CDS6105 [Scedosporium apiospermum]